MAKKKARKSHKASHRRATHAAPRKRRRSHKRARHTTHRRHTITGIHGVALLGGNPGTLSQGPANLLVNTLAVTAGLLVGSLLGGKIPAPEKLKPAIPLFLGLGGSMVPAVRKLPFATPFLMGMAGSGLLSYAKMVKPDLPYLTGDHTDLLGAQAALEGDDAEMLGAIVEQQQLLGVEEDGMGLGADSSFVTSASM